MTTIKLKNGSGAPLAGDLVQGEPALDLTNKRLYTEDSGGTVIEVGTNPTSLTTGTVTADGLTVDGGASNQPALIKSTDATVKLGFQDDTTTNTYSVTVGAVGDEMILSSGSGGGEAVRIDSSGNIKIGTASDRFSFLTASTANLQIDGGVVFDPGSGNNVEIFNYRATDMLFGNSGGEDMRIDASGNVGIGTDSPSSYPVAPELVVDADTSGGITVKTGITGYGGVFFADGTTGNEQYRGFVQYNHNNGGSVDELLFGTSGATAMRINSSGNVGIGTSAPSGVRTKIKGLAEATNLATSATSAALFIEPFSGSTWGLGIGSISGQTQYIQGVSAAGTGSRNLAIQPYGGNVGVGTGSPGAKITAYGASGTSISLNNSSTGTTAASGFQLQTGATTDAYIWNYSTVLLPLQLTTQNACA